MGAATVIPPGGGEVVGDSADRRVEILCDHDAVHVTWSRLGPGRDGADLHIHRRHTDFFYVLDGELTLRLGREGEEVPIPAGMLARVPPFVVHGFRNASDAEVRYLNLHAPGVGFADYMRAIRDGRSLTYDQEPPPADGVRPASEAVIGCEPVHIEEIAITEVSGDSVEPPSPQASHRHIEGFYVLEGELALTVGDRELRAEAGSWVQVSPRVARRVSVPARHLNVRAPA
jgi:mannose-6-phosphate isomerase-like protein (cupin superfamily)